MTNEEWAKQVDEAVKGGQPFEPEVVYNQDGDQIEVFLKNDSYYEHWINEHLTALCSQETNEVVGVVVDWVTSLTKRV